MQANIAGSHGVVVSQGLHLMKHLKSDLEKSTGLQMSASKMVASIVDSHLQLEEQLWLIKRFIQNDRLHSG